MNASTDKILFLLKSHGPQSAAELGRAVADDLHGARQHLMTLETDGWVSFKGRSPRARSTGTVVAPDRAGLATFPRQPQRTDAAAYRQHPAAVWRGGHGAVDRPAGAATTGPLSDRADQPALADRLAALTAQRTREGYMADFCQEEDGSWLLWESHCPICAAARGLLGLLSQRTGDVSPLAGAGRVERGAVSAGGDHRCLYRIRPQPLIRKRQKQQSRRRDACFVASGEGALVPARRFPVGSNG